MPILRPVDPSVVSNPSRGTDPSDFRRSTLTLTRMQYPAIVSNRENRKPLTGSLLSMDENHVLMVAEVFRHDQALARKPGSWTT